MKAYCMRCKGKKDVDNPKEGKMKNGARCVKGLCAKCGTKVFAILPK